MRRKYLYAFLLTILSILLIGICVRLYKTITYIPTAHIYIDPASSPALFQMLDLVQQPPQEPKYIAWRRYMNNIPRDLHKDINITYASINPGTSNSNFARIIERELRIFYNRYPNHQFVIHTNSFHIFLLKSALRSIPKHKIKQINFYEDAIGWTLWAKVPKEIYTYAQRYPINYYLTFAKEAGALYPRLKSVFKEINLSDFQKVSPQQKKLILEMVALNTAVLDPLFKKNTTIVLVDDCNQNLKKAIPELQKKFKLNPKLKEALWLEKNHPRCGTYGSLYDAVQSHVGNTYVLSSKIPFESFLIAGLTPDYVFGYSSSIFFSIKPEQVLGYIKRPNDPYLPIYQKMGIVQEEDIIDLN